MSGFAWIIVNVAVVLLLLPAIWLAAGRPALRRRDRRSVDAPEGGVR